MPHKHKRRKDATLTQFDLPPSEQAPPLPVGKLSGKTEQRIKSKAAASYAIDDTPKAFTRLLAFSNTNKGPPRLLDDGEAPRSVKRKRTSQSAGTQSQSTQATVAANDNETRNPLQIQPGERLGDFARRVDQALPLSGLNTKGKKVEGIKDRQTKHEKRLRRMQTQWREEEARIQEKEEEEREAAEDEWEEQLAGLDKSSRETMMSSGKVGGKSKKKRKGRALGEIDNNEEDPWAVLKQKREAPKGVFDVVQAPPRFEKIPREIFKGVNVNDVPKNAGSLRRREQLGEARANIIKSYRSMMADKRA